MPLWAQLTPLKVYVGFARVESHKEADKAMKNELKTKRDAANKARKELEKQIKQQYGKKREQWPSEQEEAYSRAEESAALANADYEYIRVEPEGLRDSAQDIIDSLAGKGIAGHKENVITVPTAEEADLVVEVVGRRSEKTMPTQIRDDQYFVSFTIAAGGKMDPARLALIPRNWRLKKWGYPGWKLQSYSPEAPYWRFETYGDQRWSNAGNVASVLIEKFIEENYDALTGTMVK
jgi:hypothetical protein